MEGASMSQAEKCHWADLFLQEVRQSLYFTMGQQGPSFSGIIFLSNIQFSGLWATEDLGPLDPAGHTPVRLCQCQSSTLCPQPTAWLDATLIQGKALSPSLGLFLRQVKPVHKIGSHGSGRKLLLFSQSRGA